VSLRRNNRSFEINSDKLILQVDRNIPINLIQHSLNFTAETFVLYWWLLIKLDLFLIFIAAQCMAFLLSVTYTTLCDGSVLCQNTLKYEIRPQLKYYTNLLERLGKMRNLLYI